MSNPVLTRTFDTERPQWLDESTLTTRSTTTMTMEGAVNKTVFLFGLLAVTATATWLFNAVGLLLPAFLVALPLGLWAAFSRKVRPAVMMAYAALEGVVLAALTLVFEVSYPGIAVQAVSATLLTSGLIFVAYTQRWVRVTSKMRQFFMFAVLGYVAFGLINLLFSFGGNSIYNTQFGWMVGLVGVGLASFSLLTDFADIEEGARAGAPQEYEWRAAFGLIVTLVWMYTEILRLIAILRGRD